MQTDNKNFAIYSLTFLQYKAGYLLQQLQLCNIRFLELLTADPGVASSIPARSHTFVLIDHEIISKTILLLSLIHRVLTRILKTGVIESIPGKRLESKLKNWSLPWKSYEFLVLAEI